VVQDQIGGESWPGSLRAFEKTPPFRAAQAAWRDEPSGRSLDPGREAGARGMIVTEQARESRTVQNPAYRLARHFSITYGQSRRGLTTRLTTHAPCHKCRWVTQPLLFRQTHHQRIQVAA